MTHIQSRHLIVATVVALVLAACGGASEIDTTTTTTTGPAVSQSTQPDIAEHTDHDEEVDSHGEEDVNQEETSHADDDTASSRSESVIEVVMTDFAFEPAAVEVKAGEILTFLLSNEGSIPHEFRLSNAHRIEEHLASGHADHGSEGGHHQGDSDVLIEVAPGKSGELTVHFPEDMTVYTHVACLLPGHYEAGMVGDLIYHQS